jgi:hypothetical protein
MHIITSFFITCSDLTCMRERERGMMCIRWSNMVVVVNCDIIAMMFTNSMVTSLAIKGIHVLYFLVTGDNPKLIFVDFDLL